MKKVLKIVIFVLILLPMSAFAMPPKGFHDGPYLRLIGGLLYTDFDNNIRTGDTLSGDAYGCFGFQFGWNIWDSMAVELEGRYSTKKTSGNREHLVNVNLNVKYSFVTNALTNLGGFHILPFVQGGPAALVSAVPGDPQSNDRTFGIYGLGFGVGAGLDFLIIKYLYLGIMFQADVYHTNSVHQNIAGTSQLVVNSGWKPVYGLIGAAGVHF